MPSRRHRQPAALLRRRSRQHGKSLGVVGPVSAPTGGVRIAAASLDSRRAGRPGGRSSGSAGPRSASLTCPGAILEAPPAGLKYSRTHIWQLRQLRQITGDTELLR